MKPSDLLAEAIANVPAPTLEAVSRVREKMMARLQEEEHPKQEEQSNATT